MRAKRRMLVVAVLTATAFSAQAASEAVLRAPLVVDESCLGAKTGTKQPQPADAPPPVLLDGLGYAGLEADSADPQARAWFAQGVRLLLRTRSVTHGQWSSQS